MATQKQPNEEVIVADHISAEDKEENNKSNNDNVCDLEPAVDVVDDVQAQASLGQANSNIDKNLIDTTGETKKKDEEKGEIKNKEVEKEEREGKQGEVVEADTIDTTGTAPSVAAAVSVVVPTANCEEKAENIQNKGSSEEEGDKNSCGSLEQDIEKEVKTTKTKMEATDYYQQQLEQQMASIGIKEKNLNNEEVYGENNYEG